jgi:hypothetical protein
MGLCAAVTIVAAGLAACHHDYSVEAARTPTFNERVLELIAEYPVHGFGGYAWPSAPGTDGTTRDLQLHEAVFAKAGRGNHCVGITLEVFWRALEKCSNGVTATLDAKAVRDLKRRWYVPTLGGRGAVDALVTYGLGSEVTLATAQPGDFMQAWNADGTSGHSMIFLGRDGDVIRYWSSQPWTEGIGPSEGTLGNEFDETRVYVARADCARRREPVRAR